MGFTKEQMAKGGSRGKRRPDSNVELLRKGLTGKLNIKQLFSEIAELEVTERVKAKIKLLAFVLPKLQSIDLSVQEVSVKDFIRMSPEQQDEYLKTLKN